MDSVRDRPVAVGLSGGTDSAMAARLLLEAGARVTAITLRLSDTAGSAVEPHVREAAQVCRRLGIRHNVMDAREAFERCVVGPFIDGYRVGATPSPCLVCNARIKFGLLLDHARELGCERLATGHYAHRARSATGEPMLCRGADPVKDQSYFLAMLDVEQLEAACFPLASWHKRDVKAAASDLGLVDRVRSESQDLCFVPGGDYTDLLVRRHPELDVPGALVSVDGREVGVHRGYFRYTIGQRRGLGLSGGPWYVVGLCPEANRVIVGRYADLMSTRVRVESLNWLVTPPAPGEPLPVLVQVRYRMRPREAVLVRESGGGAELCLKEPVAAVTPGQAAVFYHGDRVLGGGWIQSRADTVPGHRPKGV